jgi:hypothetical protein
MSKFIVTYGDRVVLDYKNSPEGVHKTFGDQISAIRYILASEGVYFRPEYFEIAVEKMDGTNLCRYAHDWTLDEIVQDVYKKFPHRFEMYKIYATVF